MNKQMDGLIDGRSRAIWLTYIATTGDGEERSSLREELQVGELLSHNFPCPGTSQNGPHSCLTLPLPPGVHSTALWGY